MVTVKVVGTTVVLSVDGKAVDVLTMEQAIAVSAALNTAAGNLLAEHLQGLGNGS